MNRLITLLALAFCLNGNAQTWLWAKSATGTGADEGNSSAVDTSGNVFITGCFSSPTITFGTSTLTNTGGGFNVFIAKYDANGNALWAKSAGTDNDQSYSVSTDATGNVFVTGYFDSPAITFGSYILTNTNVYSDAFIAKYDANGNVLCASALASGGDDQNGVSTDHYGNAYIAGDFEVNPFNVGTTSLPLTSTTSGGENVFVAKWNCNLTSGINQIKENNEQVNIYPNPNNGSFIIEPNSITKQTMQVYDVNGKLVLSQTITGKTNIDANSLNEGVYNISIISNEGILNKRLVIVR